MTPALKELLAALDAFLVSTAKEHLTPQAQRLRAALRAYRTEPDVLDQVLVELNLPSTAGGMTLGHALTRIRILRNDSEAYEHLRRSPKKRRPRR